MKVAMPVQYTNIMMFHGKIIKVCFLQKAFDIYEMSPRFGFSPTVVSLGNKTIENAMFHAAPLVQKFFQHAN